MNQIKIGLLGCGTVGTGVAKILIEQKDLIASRVGTSLYLKHIADIDTQTDRGIQFPDGMMTSDALKVVNDPEIDIIIEMIGGETIAKDLILKAIDNKKQIVTANKALLAKHGNTLFQKAQSNDCELAYEASVGGCMPIIKTIRETLVGNNIQSMTGILNGTCNYILSKITNEGTSFEVALKEAQDNGFAEADPTLDVGGFDTAHKLAVIAALAYGMKINYDDIYVEGITKITPLDISFAREFGYQVKLLAICKKFDDKIDARVHPAMIPIGNILSSVSGSMNAITVNGDCVGDLLLYGHGAGMMPTASAVISDVVDLARNLKFKTLNRVPALSYQSDQISTKHILPIEEIETNYYIRFSAVDQPGVLSKIAGILGNNNISIQSVKQIGRKLQGSVPIVMVTHMAKEKFVQTALKEIQEQDTVMDTPVIIRINLEKGEIT